MSSGKKLQCFTHGVAPSECALMETEYRVCLERTKF